jgi:hypothetical protein
MTPERPPDTDLAALQAEAAHLRRVNQELLATGAELRTTIEKQKARIDCLVRMTFGRRSERVTQSGLADDIPAPDPSPAVGGQRRAAGVVSIYRNGGGAGNLAGGGVAFDREVTGARSGERGRAGGPERVRQWTLPDKAYCCGPRAAPRRPGRTSPMSRAHTSATGRTGEAPEDVLAGRMALLQ